MDLTTGLAILGITLFLGLFLLGSAIFSSRVSIGRRIGDRPRTASAIGLEDRLADIAERYIAPLGGIMVRDSRETSNLRSDLIVAGYRRKSAVALFYGSKVALFLLLLLIVSLTGVLFQKPLQSLLLAGGVGLLGPSLWLSWRKARRQERIQLGLPDMMDLAVVCVEAGLGLDQSLVRIGRELSGTHPDLSEELRVYELETNAGMSRVQALRGLAYRTNLDSLKALTAVLIQADRFGTSIAQSLRVFADSLRTQRRQMAEERAAKLNVKMVIPLVIFIFPAIATVVVGPAIVRIAKQLLPLLSGAIK